MGGYYLPKSQVIDAIADGGEKNTTEFLFSQIELLGSP
jgi:hypothetical protein